MTDHPQTSVSQHPALRIALFTARKITCSGIAGELEPTVTFSFHFSYSALNIPLGNSESSYIACYVLHKDNQNEVFGHWPAWFYIFVILSLPAPTYICEAWNTFTFPDSVLVFFNPDRTLEVGKWTVLGWIMFSNEEKNHNPAVDWYNFGFIADNHFSSLFQAWKI